MEIVIKQALIEARYINIEIAFLLILLEIYTKTLFSIKTYLFTIKAFKKDPSLMVLV